jgi:hypothetical protein
MLSLNDKSGFNNITDLFELNKNKSWDEWLEVSKIFKSGKQGITGIFKVKNNPKIEYVFKISQFVNYLVNHEGIILNSLINISNFCPNFCRGVGEIMCNVDPLKTKNPFDGVETKYPIEKEVLLMENIKNSTKFFYIIKDVSLGDEIIYSIIKQTLVAVSIAQKKVKLTHYDLHSDNIMIRKCDENLLFLYIIDNNTQFLIHSYGYFPTIIDFGFSYCKDNENNYLLSSMNHTEIGFTSNQFDHLFDSKLFLISVSKELLKYRKSKTNKKFRNIVKNIFYKLKVDWISGWDLDTKKCATDFILSLISMYTPNSGIFSDCSYHCFDTIHSLIILPLQPNNYDNIDISYRSFIKEFEKVEDMINNQSYCLFLLKSIVDIAREIRPDYINIKKRTGAVEYFKISLYERINSISNFCNLKQIHFEKLLCSLYCLSRCIEGVLYDAILIKNNKKRYDKMKIKNIDQIYTAVDINIPQKNILDVKSKIMVIDAINEKSYFLNLKKDTMNEINKFESIHKGRKLYELLIKNRKIFEL